MPSFAFQRARGADEAVRAADLANFATVPLRGKVA